LLAAAAVVGQMTAVVVAVLVVWYQQLPNL
jgi:hypothetical protein